MAQGLLDRFAGFVRGHSTSDRAHPGVGVAFIIAAVIVLLLGLRWFSGSDGASGTTDAQSWALDVSTDGPTTTIGNSPEAVAVRVGTAVPHGADEDQTVTIGIPGTSIEIEIPIGPTTTTGPGTTGGSPTGNGSTPTTRPRTTPTTRPGGGTTTPPTTDPPTTDPPTTEPPTTDPPTTEPPTTEPPTTEPPTTEPPPPELTGLSITASIDLPVITEPSEGDLLGALVGSLGSLLG